MSTAVAVTWVGSRRMCRYGAAFGRLVARVEFTRTLLVALVAAVAAGIALGLALRPHDRVPAIFTPPAVFCPAGQHVTGVGASGWPACKAGR